jgi:hypothetical protein
MIVSIQYLNIKCESDDERCVGVDYISTIQQRRIEENILGQKS